MHLLFFDFIYSFGGAQQATGLLLNRLAHRDGLKVTPIVFHNFDQRFLQAVESLHPQVVQSRLSASLVTRKGSFFGFVKAYVFGFLFFLKAVKAALGSDDRDVVFLTNSTKGLVYVAGAWLLLGRRFRIVFYVRGSGSERSLGSASLAVIRRMVDLFLCVSSNTRANLVRRGVDAECCAVTYTTIDWSQPAADHRQTNKDLGERQSFRLLYAASIISGKGLDKLLMALREARLHVDVHLLIAGDIPYESHRAFREHCEVLAKSLPENVTVEWLGWVESMAPIVASSDAVVLLSDDEGLPRVVQEAMMQRKAVLATAVGGAPELVVDGLTGVLCDDKPGEIVSALERLVNSDVGEMGNAGYERLQEILAPEAQLELVHQALRG